MSDSMYDNIKQENTLLDENIQKIREQIQVSDNHNFQKWDDVDYYKTIHRYVFYTYIVIYVLFLISVFISRYCLSNYIKVAMIIGFFAIPFTITYLELLAFDVLNYLYCLIFTRVYEKRKIQDIPYYYYFYM